MDIWRTSVGGCRWSLKSEWSTAGVQDHCVAIMPALLCHKDTAQDSHELIKCLYGIFLCIEATYHAMTTY